MASSDFIGRIGKSQETRQGSETSAPQAPVVHGDPALARLQSLQQPQHSNVVLDNGMGNVSAEMREELLAELQHLETQPQPTVSKPGFWTGPKATKAFALGGVLVGAAAGAFALGGAGFMLALAAEALAFAGGMLFNKSKMDELEEENRKLRDKASTDPLIGINNRRAIDDILAEQLLRAPFKGASVSVIMADVDHFKKINDTYGHQVGDEVLIEVAQRVREGMRSQDSVGRYGGEEFLMVLPGIGGTQAVLIAHRIRLLIAQESFDTSEGDISVTMSLGVSSTDFPNLVPAERLVNAADKALYQAKHEGRNRVVLSVHPEG